MDSEIYSITAGSTEEGVTHMLFNPLGDEFSSVRYIKHMGNDLDVVNSARASFAKESKELGSADIKLLKFLMREKHYSPLRHSFVTFEIKAPLMVARQWWRYAVGSTHTEAQGWSEMSKRYVTSDTEVYCPKVWRTAAENKKQGSGEDFDLATSLVLTTDYIELMSYLLETYNKLLASGVAPEQARLVLPANACYTTWRWTASLQALFHFLDERLDPHAQYEIRRYAECIQTVVATLFPETYKAYLEPNA